MKSSFFKLRLSLPPPQNLYLEFYFASFHPSSLPLLLFSALLSSFHFPSDAPLTSPDPDRCPSSLPAGAKQTGRQRQDRASAGRGPEPWRTLPRRMLKDHNMAVGLARAISKQIKRLLSKRSTVCLPRQAAFSLLLFLFFPGVFLTTHTYTLRGQWRQFNGHKTCKTKDYFILEKR